MTDRFDDDHGRAGVADEETPAQFRERIGQLAHRAEVDLVVGDAIPVWQINPWEALPAHAHATYRAIASAVYCEALRDAIVELQDEHDDAAAALIQMVRHRGIDVFDTPEGK